VLYDSVFPVTREESGTSLEQNPCNKSHLENQLIAQVVVCKEKTLLIYFFWYKKGGFHQGLWPAGTLTPDNK